MVGIPGRGLHFAPEQQRVLVGDQQLAVTRDRWPAHAAHQRRMQRRPFDRAFFPELFDFVWPTGSIGEQDCDINHFCCGLIGDGGAWGRTLEEFLMTDEVTAIYSAHGLERAG